MRYLLIRYGEIFLKGKNQYQFLATLVRNIRSLTGYEAKCIQSRVIMDYFSDHIHLRRVFGLGSYSICEKVPQVREAICAKALEILSSRVGTFRVETKRSDKRFPLTSLETNRVVGEYIESNTTLTFSLKNPDVVLFIEINEAGAFLFTESFLCCGGLPVGCEGRVGVLLEDEYSTLAGVSVMRRGCGVFALTVGSSSKVDISLLQKFSPVHLQIYHFDNWLLVDDFMMENKLSSLVCSSQNLVVRSYPCSSVVLHPLVCETEMALHLLKEKYESL